MFKMLLLAAGLCLAASGAAAPAYAANNAIPTGPGCTLNPFDHTWRCIDFSRCKKAPDGTYTDCPVTTGTYLSQRLNARSR
ncbi:MAG: hypothetical protein P4M09_32095 [Devosia sp.]|nr:hypothetical protein [Devosia sp.]